jgi:hypothetical protein
MKSPLKKLTNPNELNIGVRLYQKGVKKMEERDRFCQDVKDIIETKIQQELIFKPKINTKSVTRSTVNRDKS